MKSTRRILTILMAIAMTLALSLCAFAATPSKGNLQVDLNNNNSLKGQTLSVYKLFDLTTDKTNYGYKVNPAFKGDIEAALGKTNLTSDQLYDEVSKLAPSNSVTINDFAQKFATEILTRGAEATQKSPVLGNVTEYTFRDLDFGYYLVYQTGTLSLQASLVTVDDAAVSVTLKGEKPSITKEADKNTAEIGEIVTYTVAGTIPDTTGYDQYVYKIHDELSSGLDFVKNAAGEAIEQANTVAVSVKIGNAGTAETVNATVKERTMEVDLSGLVKLHKDQKGEEFTVTYYAKVNKTAVITEKNSAALEYGNMPGATERTVPVEVQTHTYPLQVKKIDKTTQGMLFGAKFRLYRNLEDAKAANEKAIKVSEVTLGENGSYVFDEKSTNMDMVSGKADNVKGFNLCVNGLKEGIYYLVETEAPAGYNKITAPVMITVAKSADDTVANWTLTKENQVEDDKIIDIENSTGTILPSTGGMGTTIFTVIAVVMIASIALSFVYSKKKSN